MVLVRTIQAVLLAAAFAAPATAQVKVFGGSVPRMATTRLFFSGNTPAGLVCVQYGQPVWKAEYDAKLDSLKGTSLRLGKDFWTTLNTSVALTIGGTKVEAGSYYLGLKCDAEGGFHLLLLKAESADKQGFAPFFPDPWKPDYACAMKRTAGETLVEKMVMDLTPDEKTPTQMTFSVAWGKHVLSVPVQAHLAGAPAAGAK